MHARTHRGRSRFKGGGSAHAARQDAVRRHTQSKCGGSAPAARQEDVRPSLQPTRPDVKPLGLQRGSSLCGRSCCLKVIERHQQAMQRAAKGASSGHPGAMRLYARAGGREDHEETSRIPVGSSLCGRNSQECPLLLATQRHAGSCVLGCEPAGPRAPGCPDGFQT